MIEMIQTEWKRKYNRLEESDKKTYHKNYMRKLRENKQIYYLRTQRGMLGRYIDERQVFSERDYSYLKKLYK